MPCNPPFCRPRRLISADILHVVTIAWLAAALGCAAATTANGADPNNSSTSPPGTNASNQIAGGTLTGDSNWAGGTYEVNGALTVTNGTLRILAGTTVVMNTDSGTALSILIGKGGALQVLGTASNPVTFTSSAGVPKRGDWGAIEFLVGSLTTNIIQNANFAYGGGAFVQGTVATGAIVLDAGTTASITNTIVENSSTFGVAITGDATLTGFANNVLAHNTLGPISLTANVAGQLQAGTYTPNDVEGIDIIVSQLTQNATWGDLGTPYVLEGLTLETLTGTAVLTVQAGTTLLMAPRSTLVVQANGALNLAGTQAKPILVSSASNPAARGDWAEIDFYANSKNANNKITYADIEFGGGNLRGAVWLEAGAQLSMQNSTISNSADVGLYVTPKAIIPNFSNNRLINNALNPMRIDVDDVRQLQGQNGTYTPNAVEGILVQGTLLATDTHWGPLGTRYVVGQQFAVDRNTVSGTVTWTLDAGTTIAFQASVGVEVNAQGVLVVNGTVSQPVLFTAFDETQGWNEVRILSTSSSNSIANAIFRFSGTENFGGLFMFGGHAVVQNVQMGESIISDCGHLECNNGVLRGPNNSDPNAQINSPCDPTLHCPP